MCEQETVYEMNEKDVAAANGVQESVDGESGGHERRDGQRELIWGGGRRGGGEDPPRGEGGPGGAKSECARGGVE